MRTISYYTQFSLERSQRKILSFPNNLTQHFFSPLSLGFGSTLKRLAPLPHVRPRPAVLTVHAGGSVPGCPGHLARQTRTLDCLGALLDAVLIAASVSGDHFTRASLWCKETTVENNDETTNQQKQAVRMNPAKLTPTEPKLGVWNILLFERTFCICIRQPWLG